MANIPAVVDQALKTVSPYGEESETLDFGANGGALPQYNGENIALESYVGDAISDILTDYIPQIELGADAVATTHFTDLPLERVGGGDSLLGTPVGYAKFGEYFVPLYKNPSEQD